jgi:SEC-C motif-containing protein
MPAETCPCGSGKYYRNCCADLIEGKGIAQAPEQLMRSRFSAYVLQQTDYLYQTWHPDTRPALSELEDKTVQWQQLQVIAADNETVEFLAIGHTEGQPIILHELSSFSHTEGQWFYLDGLIFTPPSKNGACPCGSGKKFKRCCGKEI